MRLLGIIACFSLFACAQLTIQAQEKSSNLCDSIVTHDLLQCASIRLSKADAQLNAIYRESVSFAGENQEVLRDVQRTWLGFRDEYCNGIYEESRGGNEADIDKAFCLASLTEDRVAELSLIGKGNDETGLLKALRALERAGYDRQEVLDRLASNQEGSRWQQYSNKNCEFLEQTSKMAKTKCLARLNLERSY
ncbi:lysozyme inhibitor LprI family protein [Luteimonas sp. MJ293]|uniref:lysozyme inhibitor LprI family protein n=1 Tax=Luteimonas sp. MJ146 TaxID=3129240 RepID=UPI0031BB6C6E